MDFPEIVVDLREFESQPWLLNALPRIHALMHSNEPLKAAETPFIRLAVAELDQLVTRLDKKIISFARERLVQPEDDHANVTDDEIVLWVTQLERLEDARARFACCDDAEHAGRPFASILSAIRRMPPEIFREIFAWTLPNATTNKVAHTIAESMNESPWVLTYVCSVWRAAAISTPSLWSFLALPRACSVNLDCHYPLAVVKAQVERASTLAIYFSSGPGCGTEGSDAVETLEHLIEHSPRWEEAFLQLTPELESLLPALRDRLPSLRKLRLCWINDERDSEAPSDIDYFETAESLVHVTIDCWPRHSPSLRVLLPANQLTHYHVNAPWKYHVEILRQSPTLVEAHISSRTRPVQGYRAESAIILPALRSLYLSEAGVVSCLHVPNLEQFTLKVRRLETWTHLSRRLEQFIERTSHSVRRLGLHGVGDDGAELVAEILRRYTGVTELAVIFTWHQYNDITSWGASVPVKTPDPESLVSRLAVDATTPIVGPRLTHIHLVFEKDPQPFVVDSRIVLRMLKSRVDAPQCGLRAATLLFQSGTVKESKREPTKWERLRRQGLELSIVEDEEDKGNAIMKPRFMARWMCGPDWLVE